MKKHFLFLGLLTMSSTMFHSCEVDDEDVPSTSNTVNEDLLSIPSGDGTAAAPFRISNANELLYYSAVINGNVDTIPQNKSAYGIVVADIDMSSICGGENGTWKPIGFDTVCFSGVFDGGNHSINNIYIANSTIEGQGLFGKIKGAEIKNVIIGSGEIKSDAICTAAIVGEGSGYIVNCHNYANIENSKKFTGGVVGYLSQSSTIERCHNEGEIRGINPSKSQFAVGGIAGAANAGCVVKDCYNLGKVTGESSRVAGIVGSAEDCHISNCYSYADVASLSNDYGGGICAIACGYPYTTVVDCYFYNSLGQGGQQPAMARLEEEFNNGTIFKLLDEQSANVWKQVNGNYPILK